MHRGQRRTDVIRTTADGHPAVPDPAALEPAALEPAVPEPAVPEPVSSRGLRPGLIEVLGHLAGGSAVDGPLGLLAVEAERLAAERHLTTAEEPSEAAPPALGRWRATLGMSPIGDQNEEGDSHERERL
jgi:hypothetical protein